MSLAYLPSKKMSRTKYSEKGVKMAVTMVGEIYHFKVSFIVKSDKISRLNKKFTKKRLSSNPPPYFSHSA